MKFASVLSVALCVLSLTSTAGAQGRDIASAEALFQEGRRLMDEGKSKAACPKFEESQRLDPGTGTLWHLGRCYQETGRLAKAWATYHQVAQEAQRTGETAKVKAALKRAKELKPKLHNLVIIVPKEHLVDDLVVTRDGITVGNGAWGAKVPVDLGKILIEASAAEHRGWSKTVKVAGKAKLHSVTVPLLKKRPKIIAPIPKPIVVTKRANWYEDKWGWTVLASSVAVVAAGAGATFYAGSLEDDASGSSDLGERDRLLDQSETYGLAGGVLLAAGAGLAVTGIVLLAVTPTVRDTAVARSQTSPSIAIDANQVTFSLSKHF
jgi:tetratricopeptide (TPR) repeat protein